MVATLWTFDTLTTVFVAHSLFIFVHSFLNRHIDLNIPWSFTAEKLLVTIITFISQIFYAHTIWKLGGVKFPAAFIVFLAVASFGLGIYTTVHLFENPALNSISTRGFLIVSGLVQGLAAFNDVVITGTLSYFLHTRRNKGLASSEKLIDTLIVYAVSRGVLTAIAQLMFLVLNVAVTNHTYWLPFHMVVGKLYVNSVLATLNVRKTLSGTQVNLGTGISIGMMNTDMDETRTKPITFAAIRGPESVSSIGSFSRSNDPERGY